MKTYSAILIGAGMRGQTYTGEMLKVPDRFKVIAVAEPVENRRKKIQELHGIADETCFNGWEEALAQPKMADIAIICTMDDMHYAPAMKAIELGYDVLLEKPVAPTAKECADIALAAEKKGVKVLVCHVLRYTPFYKKVKELVMSGMIGDVVSIVQVEALGNIHQSHSYVRGNWHSEAETSPMLLAKCCHDLDILQWLVDKPCKKVQSFGQLTYFTAANAPEGAPKRCIDGGCPVADTCIYNAKKLYYDDKENSWFRGSCTRDIAKGEVPTDEEVMQALQTTDYGLCVFQANNDVVDHQTVNMEFEGGANVTLSMNPFNKGGRYIRIFGTKGELAAHMEDETISVYTLDDCQHHEIPTVAIGEDILSGHGGGDAGLVCELYEYLSGDYKGYCAADIHTSVKNHLIGFAAERSRRNDTVESLDAYFREYGFENQ